MQTTENLTLEQALASYDRESNREYVVQGEAERKQLIDRFPRQTWPSMPIESYALGQSGNEGAFCAWIEYRSPHLGSIAGGSAKKHLIYRRKSGNGWYFDPAYPAFEKAWEEIRGAFVRAFELADANEWPAIDQLKPIAAGPSLRVKTLHVYFPQHVLPIAARPHLLHFLKQLGLITPELESAERVTMNRALTAAVLSMPQFKGWSTNEIERFLYSWSDPRESARVLKIAPGEDARHWPDCLDHGYIRVGWDEVGDLHGFAGKEEFEEQFRASYLERYNGHAPTIKKKGNELWQLAELEEGDIIVANKGISHVLAVGEVVAPGYEWMPNLSEYRHTVRVKWDTTFEQDIDPQKRWGLVTIANIPSTLYEAIREKSAKKGAPQTVQLSDRTDPVHVAMAEALERKGQLILYGPPGTGKTYEALRFGVWWLLKSRGENSSTTLANRELFDSAVRRLTTTVSAPRAWWVVTNPKHWQWDVLFNTGSQVFQRRRVDKNYKAIRKDDLVVGYQATPGKRIVAIAKISKIPSQLPSGGFELVPVRKVTDGPSHEELLQHPTLKDSEPFRLNNQGTLFSLTPNEVEELADMIGERDPESGRALTEENVGGLTITTFHPSYTYEDFVEGLRPFDAGEGRVGLRLEDGVFKRLCHTAEANPTQNFLLIIDEFNRANIAKVFGELITVLERDKRGLPLVLPQSKQLFSVPKNLYILATMNTADRSIRLLDAALRRRFAFREFMPDSQTLQGSSVSGLALDELMEFFNSRISKQLGREKQIGHSYFLNSEQPVTDPDQFAQQFRQEIVPILQDYCYEDYGALATYLGTKLVNVENQRFNEELLNDATGLIAALTDLVTKDQPA